MGALTYPNSDATSFTRDPNFSWVVSIVGDNPGDDYDLQVLDDYSGSTVGFDSVIGESVELMGVVDFVVGHYSSPQTTVYPAVTRYDGIDLDGFAIDQTDATGHEAMGSGTWLGQVLESNRLADVYDVYLTGGQRYFFELQRLVPGSDLYFGIFPETPGAVFSRWDMLTFGIQFGEARSQLVFEPAVDGWYPVVVHRLTQDRHQDPVEYDFRFEPTLMTGLPDDVFPTAFALRSVAPNPVSARAQIRFALPAAGRVNLELFDVRGRRVRRLLDATYPPGVHSVLWDSRDGRGQQVAAGTYWARLSMGAKVKTMKLTVLR